MPGFLHPIHGDAVELALSLARSAHAGQVDQAGAPIIEHVQRVVERVRTSGGSDIALAAAALHDTVEDTEVTLEDLVVFGFPADVVDAVDALTRREGERYADYVARAAAHPIAREVKIADNADNTARLSNLPPERAESLGRRYATAREILGV